MQYIDIESDGFRADAAVYVKPVTPAILLRGIRATAADKIASLSQRLPL